MDWKLKLMQVLDVVGDDLDWSRIDMSDVEKDIVRHAYERHEAASHFRNSMDQVIHESHGEGSPEESAEEVLDFEHYLAARTFEQDEPMAHADIVWCKHSFTTSFTIRDLARGGDVLRPPQTVGERHAILMNLRWLLNWQAWKWKLPGFIHESDWFGDPPTALREG